MDAITLLKDDHKTVEALFKRFEKAGDNAHVEKGEIVRSIIEELSGHAAVEEQLFYPVTRATVPETEDIVLESLEEHHIVKWVLSELDGMDPEDERFVAKVTVLMENVRHHVKEEEAEYFPMVRDELGRNALNDLGDAMEAAKQVAPTHPHPRAPDVPPGNLLAGTAAGVVDRIGDTVSGLAQGGVTAVGDVIATVLRRKQPTVSPTGSKGTRKTARKVRASASDARGSVAKQAKRAKRTGTSTAKAAARGATQTAKAAKAGSKGTATSARKATKRTATTAKRGVTATARKATKTAKAAKSATKGTATSTRKATKRTSTTAKRAATTTARTAKKAVKSTASTAKRSARSR
ncbi:MAG: hemerythrin domain-containing protein [Acidimicrobiales bacterium]